LSRDLVVAIDASTTAVKCVVWDAKGRLVSEGRAGITLRNPEPLGYEQDAEEWWSATREAIRRAVDPIDPGRLAAVCIANQRETVVIVDADGRPRAPALVWMDERCRPQVERVRQREDVKRIHAISGKPVCATPSLYKLLWLKERSPELFENDFFVLDVHAFLVHRLTGELRTSLPSADPTGLTDLRSGDWSDDLLDLLGWGRSRFPEILPVGAEIGRVTAAETALPVGLPVVAGAGDGQAAGLGAGISSPGRAYLNLGTALVSGVYSGSYETDRAFRTLAGTSPGTYFLETDLKGGTFTVDWLLEKWFPNTDPSECLQRLQTEAMELRPGAEGLMLVPYWCGVMNPYWDDDAGGIIVGLRGHHGPAHLYRAILEGLSFEQRLHTEGVEAATGIPIDEYVVVGGGAASDLWCQIIADISGKPIRRSMVAEATALGAGMIACVGAGIHPDFAAATNAMTGSHRAFQPGPDRGACDSLFAKYTQLYPALRSIA
jgi:xylulokinase